MNTNKLPDYLGHMQSAAEDACGFILNEATEGLAPLMAAYLGV